MLLLWALAALGLPGCTGVVTYIKSDTRNDNIQCEPDESQIKLGDRSCVIIQQGKTTTNSIDHKMPPTDKTTATQAEASHD
ncbi:hypothetical protein D3C85_1222570 [compost metagenome]